MSRTWKWILGIILGLVVLAGIGFVAANFFGYGHMAFWGRPMMDGYGFNERGPFGGYQNFRHPMMGGRGFGLISWPFFLLGGLLRLIFPLAVLGLVAFFFYQAGKRTGMRTIQVARSPEPAPAPEPEETSDEGEG